MVKTWQSRIDRARVNGFSVHDLQLAREYSTCAVGEHLGGNRSYATPESLNPVMYELSFKFYRAVLCDDAVTAQRVYNEIHAVPT